MSKDLENTATRSRGEVMGLRVGRETKETTVLPPKHELAGTKGAVSQEHWRHFREVRSRGFGEYRRREQRREHRLLGLGNKLRDHLLPFLMLFLEDARYEDECRNIGGVRWSWWVCVAALPQASPCSNAQHVLFPLKICSPQMKSPIPTTKYGKIKRRIEVEILLRFELSSCFWAYANLCL